MAFSKEEHPHRRKIRRSSIQLLYENGYAKTSYTAMAKRSGFGRSLIQHYYPTKQQLIADLVAEISEAIDRCLQAEPAIDNFDLISSLQACYGDLIHSAQLYYGILLYDENMVRLTKEILSTRFLSTAAIEQNVTFVTNLLGDEEKTMVRMACIRAVEGTYGLIYDLLAKELPLDVNALSLSSVGTTFMYLSDTMSYRSINEYLRGFLWPEEHVRELLDAIVEDLFRP